MKKFKIGLHPLWLDTDPNGGVATYWCELIRHFEELNGGRKHFTVYYPEAAERFRRRVCSQEIELRPMWPSSRWLEVPVGLPIELYRRPVDLLHVQSLAPPMCPVNYVQTINDLAWITNPEVFPPFLRWRLSTMCRWSSKRALKIITVSQFARRMLLEHYGLPEEKVVVIYHGVNQIYRPVRDPKHLEGIKRKFAADCPFALYVGKIQARKNLVRLVQAFKTVTERGMPHKLLLVGKRTYLSDDIFAEIAKLGLTERVQHVGEVSAEDLHLLFAAAELFVFPSLSEGFGIPPLEAMACGTPVVASNATSLPEVVGDAGLTVNPYDTAALADAMCAVLASEELRRRLSEKALRRAALFSNRRMAEQTLDVYEGVLAARATASS
ncbi:MAG: glycosyltransferase family 4 protein [Bryobacterales bacterium]|nr:glycosyltransferase family 4 protein [Bryobacterales bacterium]